MNPDIPLENLSWKDRGIEVEEIKDKQRKDGLREWSLKINTENAPLPTEEKEFLNKYEGLTLHAWGKTEGDSGEIQESFNECGFVLAGGLASNRKTWDSGNSFVSSLGKNLEPVSKKWLALGLDCPGFGGSNLKEGSASEENVSSEEYQKLMKIVLKYMGGAPEKTVIVGHSSGAEAALSLCQEGYKVYASNPAVKERGINTFTAINILNGVGDRFVNILPKVVYSFAKGITGVYVGKFVSPFLDVHGEEQSLNWKSFVAKCKELGRKDKYPGKPSVMPRILMTQGDRLTPIKESVSYIINWLRQFNPSISKEEILSLIIPVDEKNSKEGGHNAMFEIPEVTEAVTGEIAGHVKSVKTGVGNVMESSKDPVISSLIEQAMKGKQAVEAEQEVDIKDKEKAMLAWSLEIYSNLARTFGAPGIEISSNRQAIRINRATLEEIVSSFVHPYIMEKEAIEAGKEMDFVQQQLKEIVSMYQRCYVEVDELRDILLVRNMGNSFLDQTEESELAPIVTDRNNREVSLKEIDQFFTDVRDRIILKLITAYVQQSTDVEVGPFLEKFISSLHAMEVCKEITIRELIEDVDRKTSGDRSS